MVAGCPGGVRRVPAGLRRERPAATARCRSRFHRRWRTTPPRTIEAAERLWERVDRPNLMVKIPGTLPGLAAITHCLADGININITLLFSVERYQQVIEAFIAGLERAPSRNRRSTDLLGGQLLRQPGRRPDRCRARPAWARPAGTFLHQMAIANARLAYASLRGVAPRAALAGARRARRQAAAAALGIDQHQGSVALRTSTMSRRWSRPTPSTPCHRTLSTPIVDHGHPEVRIDPGNRGRRPPPCWRVTTSSAAATLAERDGVPGKEGVKKFTASWQPLLQRVEKKAAHPRRLIVPHMQGALMVAVLRTISLTGWIIIAMVVGVGVGWLDNAVLARHRPAPTSRARLATSS